MHFLCQCVSSTAGQQHFCGETTAIRQGRMEGEHYFDRQKCNLPNINIYSYIFVCATVCKLYMYVIFSQTGRQHQLLAHSKLGTTISHLDRIMLETLCARSKRSVTHTPCVCSMLHLHTNTLCIYIYMICNYRCTLYARLATTMERKTDHTGIKMHIRLTRRLSHTHQLIYI